MVKFSNYQNDFFGQAEANGHILLNAVAGSGKTFSILEFMKRTKGKSIFVAFNKSIANELASKVPAHVESSTLHSFGLKAIRKRFGYIKVDGAKVDKLLQKYPATSFKPDMTNQEKAVLFQQRKQIRDLVSIWKNTGIDYNNNDQVRSASDYYNINYDPNVLGSARSIMEKSIKSTNWIDFDDMIYIPVAYDLDIPQYANVFVDECQDLNRTQISFILKMIRKPNGRIIAVGDPKQSIYGFRGADVKAMDRIREALDAKEMPLSVCYRCPSSHIELAKEIVEHIEAAPNAKEGIVEHIDESELIPSIDKENDPMILCRTNAPLISIAIQMIKQGKNVHVRGQDLGNYLKSIIVGFKANSIAELNSSIDKWESEQLEFLHKRQASNAIKQNVMDYADVLRIFTENETSPYNVTQAIDKLFSDTKHGCTLSTVHKAKGLEAETVYIVKPNLMPLVFEGQKDWELDQEEHIRYVAYTRSTNKLVFVKEDV